MARTLLRKIDQYSEEFKARIDNERQLLEVVREYIHFYNERRLHSSIGYMAPAKYEQSL